MLTCRGLWMLSELKLRATIGIFYLLGLIVRKIAPDPLADFFDEMERSGRLKIKEDPEVSFTAPRPDRSGS